MSEQTWYRVEENYYTCHLSLKMLELPVLKHTPKGVWLGRWPGVSPSADKWDKRFVNRSHKKRWACPSKEEAIVSFKRRKEVQKSKLTNQLYSVQEALRLIERPDYFTKPTRFLE